MNGVLVHTNVVDGKVTCFATINGYDYSVSKETVSESRKAFREILKKHNLKGRFTYVENFDTPLTELKDQPHIRWQPRRLDYL